MKNKIKKYRLQMGISQQDLANACGVSRETICRIEANRSNPSLVLAYHIARRLGSTVEDVFLLEEEIILQ
ncbi:MAG: helix-turn-helix transcriptional regulator [Firmicutes bacterium]|jgi:putative transcriptional regulator|nr:helix-turn-helix transcriptional regulator [Bacillota bacterium]